LTRPLTVCSRAPSSRKIRKRHRSGTRFAQLVQNPAEPHCAKTRQHRVPMNLSALIAAAYVEVQRTTGRKPSLSSRINRVLQRPVEPDFAALRHFKPPAGTCYVDIGANRGETIASARLFLPDVPIVAFEPNPLLHPIIERRNRGDRQLTLQRVGLSDQPGSFDLHVPYYKGVPFDGLASFRREEAATWLNPDRLVGFDAKHQEIRTFNCQVSTLDAFGLRPSFIKIDVQGLEPAVIRGGHATIAAHLPVVLMENNDPERDAAGLLELGYRAYAWQGAKLVENATGELNTFYVHPSTRTTIAAAL
jgi:FkbM family methyltransferase